MCEGIEIKIFSTYFNFRSCTGSGYVVLMEKHYEGSGVIERRSDLTYW
jgi:hypothetical protein